MKNLIGSKFNLIGPVKGANLVIFMRVEPSGVSLTIPRTWISFLEMLELPTDMLITGLKLKVFSFEVLDFTCVRMISKEQKRQPLLDFNTEFLNDQGLKQAIKAMNENACKESLE